MTTTGASACERGHDDRDRSAHASPAAARGMRPGSRRRYRAVLAAGVAIGMLLGAGDEAAWAGALLPERGGSPNADRIASLYTVVLVLAALVFAGVAVSARLRARALPRATQSGGGADPRQHAAGDRVDGRRGGLIVFLAVFSITKLRCDRASRPRRRRVPPPPRPASATAVAARCTSMSSAGSTCGCTSIPNGAYSYEEMVAPVGVTVRARHRLGRRRALVVDPEAGRQVRRASRLRQPHVVPPRASRRLHAASAPSCAGATTPTWSPGCAASHRPPTPRWVARQKRLIDAANADGGPRAPRDAEPRAAGWR